MRHKFIIIVGPGTRAARSAAVSSPTTANGAQKVAVAAGFTHIAWPTKIVRAKIVVLGLDSAAASQ
jgi:hypothetical protein